VVAALVVAALLSAVGGLALGEYEFTGLMPYIAGVLFGLVIAEVVLEIGQHRSPVIAALCAACVAGGIGWAAWLDSGEGLRPYPAVAWVAMALGALTVGWRTGGWRQRTRSNSG